MSIRLAISDRNFKDIMALLALDCKTFSQKDLFNIDIYILPASDSRFFLEEEINRLIRLKQRTDQSGGSFTKRVRYSQGCNKSNFVLEIITWKSLKKSLEREREKSFFIRYVIRYIRRKILIV
jgi:hypothetical protein